MNPGENPNRENPNRRKSQHLCTVGENPNIVNSQSEKTRTFKNMIYICLITCTKHTLNCYFRVCSNNKQHTYKISDLGQIDFRLQLRQPCTAFKMNSNNGSKINWSEAKVIEIAIQWKGEMCVFSFMFWNEIQSKRNCN